MSACEGLTPRARRLLERVRAAIAVAGDPFAFMISGGCCGGTNPVLCRQSNILAGFDVQIGAVDDIPVYAHPDHAQYLLRDRFVVDVIDNVRSDTFSLEIPYGARFVLRELPASREK
jgi:uncharacterized protein (DUF779 family)